MRGSVGRALLPVLGVLVLVGVVAVASTGSTPSGTTDSRPPADLLLDTFFSLALLALIPGAVLLVYGLMQRKEIAQEIASGRYRRTSLPAFLLFMLFFSLVVYYGYRNGIFPLGGNAGVVEIGRPAAPTPDGEGLAETRRYEAELAWIPVLVVVGLTVTGVVAYVLASRRRRVGPVDDAVAADEVADSIEDTLDDLRAEPDPRRAVIAAYARLEQALASAGLPRRPAETAEEFVLRILARLEVDHSSARRLTELFETAKFSDHVVGDAMKASAIDALARIRDDLRELARRRQAESAEPVREAPAS